MLAAPDLGELTARERDVVLAAAGGADTRAIAEQLCLSSRTVEHHLSAAYRKLGVPNLLQRAAHVSAGAVQAYTVPAVRYSRIGTPPASALWCSLIGQFGVGQHRRPLVRRCSHAVQVAHHARPTAPAPGLATLSNASSRSGRRAACCKMFMKPPG
jgi:DNA-binding CsgD family transcriptional regulator